ncbi:MAG: ATP-binding cassette domain-containing protein [Syntrophobacteraceae bacterium]
MADNERIPRLITVDKLRKYYGEVKSVNDISLEIAQGQVLTLVGANGAGKTTLLNLLTGLVKPDRGEIRLLGEKITGVPPDQRAKKGIVKTFQLEHLFEDMTVFDNVRTACLSSAGKHYSLFKDVNDEKDINGRTDYLLELFDLTSVKYIHVRNLGHGYKKVIDIAMCFAMEPKILLVDEPTSGVGEEEKFRIMNLLMNQIQANNLAAIIVEHDLHLVKELSKETIVMCEGEFIARGTPEDVFSQEKVVEILVGKGF